MSEFHLPVRVIVATALAMQVTSCKSKEDTFADAGTFAEYGLPVGARVAGNARIASFELALAAQGAPPDDCLPMAIQAVTNMASQCPGVPAELVRKGQVAITFETRGGQIDPVLVASEYFDDAGLECVRDELKKAITRLPQQQQVKYLLQVRPLAS